MTLEEMKALPKDEQKALFQKISKQRSVGKSCNFASVYSCGPATLARTTGLSKSEAKKLLEAYWKRNWAVKAFAEEDCEVKENQGQMWIKNPISRLWMQLRTEKDKFSAVNQSTAVFIFDLWVKEVINLGVKVCYQCHDEILFNVPEGEEDKARELLQLAMDRVNAQLTLNVVIRMDPQFGKRYSDCH